MTNLAQAKVKEATDPTVGTDVPLKGIILISHDQLWIHKESKGAQIVPR